jgi:hypothetical protein
VEPLTIGIGQGVPKLLAAARRFRSVARALLQRLWRYLRDAQSEPGRDARIPMPVIEADVSTADASSAPIHLS